eukprot:CAMPEP_0168723514 /NCGR_PEP_ID=MMETSP0724-20121128/3156_1 /TAXON_ID=265536 /ORGANISM="Amphiprora sp., Strain CCMP467" /LENGTH=1368 /DNA_ID=CAMNT_0008770227 /DNA_START=87 /DNA_END=4190 /DNA_ORIENTATION=-
MATTAANSAVAAASAAMDPASLLMNTQLASALSLTGDAQYWEESISPNTIRQELSAADPSNPTSTPNILRGMKWLLASISKGRNVSDFYPYVVKLVGAVSLEVRKMVYMYLVQYADHDASTRELSLLSINAFQRGLADAEQWIRALALRVLTSIRIPDILQIQILGVQKCAQDNSPYVRKCAASALAKLYARCQQENRDDVDIAVEQQELLLQVCRDLLYYDQATMVLTSALIAWQEMCPHKLDMLHGCFRKFCHLLTDMDEWGQVVVIDAFSRYCRMYFAEPAGFRDGSAERIDRERRVRRTIYGLESEQPFAQSSKTTAAGSTTGETDLTGASPSSPMGATLADQAALAGVALPPRNKSQPSKIKRRVVKKGFYSDDDDESTEEEVYAESSSGPSLPVASAMRQRNVMGVGAPSDNSPFVPSAPSNNTNNNTTNNFQDGEDGDLAEDHRLFLNAAMHLLKSRNAGVVLAVCSLQYYCGVSSIKVRAALGKALVRIHRDRREIQYVVLASIRTLASECPSAFSPFLHDFFVKALDPPFTRIIKLDILTSLALEPSSIDAVLQEMRTYVRHGDIKFATAAIRAVGRVVELARIVYDRHAARTSTEQRPQSDKIALNVLHGLLTLTQARDQYNQAVVGEAVSVMRLILQLLQNDFGPGGPVKDPNNIQERCIQRMFLLLMKTVTARIAAVTDNDEKDVDEDDEEEKEGSALNAVVNDVLPEKANATAIWVIGEHLSEFAVTATMKPFQDESARARIRLEMARMLARGFPELSADEKEQVTHVATKLMVSRLAGVQCLDGEGPLCEQILAMGRVDVNPDVRDRARYESALLRTVSALKFDFDGMDEYPLSLGGGSEKPLSLEDAKKMLLLKKPTCSSLPVENHSNTHGLNSEGFRFGTLSSLVGHQARSAYIRLPPWAEKDSASSLRAPADKKPKEVIPTSSPTATNDVKPTAIGGFYKDDDRDESTSDSASSSSESSDDSSSSSDSDDDSSSEEDSVQPAAPPAIGNPLGVAMSTPQPQQADIFGAPAPQKVKVQTVKGDDDSSSDDSDSSDDDSSDDEAPTTKTKVASSGSLIPNLMNNGSDSGGLKSMVMPSNGVGSASDDMKGLVLTPVVSDGIKGVPTDPDIERDSSEWIQLVRPDHTQGLTLRARYLRGPTKTQQAQLLGIADAEKKTNLVILQLHIESQATSSNVFRRVKLLQRPTSISSSTIGPRKVYLPQEIHQMKAGQHTECILGVEFASASDRDETLLAKLDFKFGSGGIPLEIKPSLGYMLLPCQRATTSFDDEMKQLQGFQRVESVIEPKFDMVGLQTTILRSAALTVVGSGVTKESMLRLVGCLPASGDPVYVVVNKQGASFKLTVCSDNAIAANS